MQMTSTGRYASDFFNRHGELRHIKRLKYWPLDKVLTDKYRLAEGEVRPTFVLCASVQAWCQQHGLLCVRGVRCCEDPPKKVHVRLSTGLPG